METNRTELTKAPVLKEEFARMMHYLGKEKMRGFLNGDKEGAWRKRLLHMIAMHPGVKVSELKERMARFMPAAEELLLGLEGKGYLAYQPVDNSDDKIVELTELGQKEAAAFLDTNAFDVLSGDEQAVLCGYIARINAAFKDKAGEEDDSFPHGFMPGGLSMEHMRKMFEFFFSKMHGREQHGDSADFPCGLNKI